MAGFRSQVQPFAQTAKWSFTLVLPLPSCQRRYALQALSRQEVVGIETERRLEMKLRARKIAFLEVNLREVAMRFVVLLVQLQSGLKFAPRPLHVALQAIG